METRDILNHLGQVIGHMELPDNTPEEIWAEKLAVYSSVNSPAIESVSPRQIRQALFLSAAITEEIIDTALNSLPDPEKTLALINWKYATSFERTNSLVDGVAGLLGWTSQQLDDLWIYAATL
jgi:hypothetical protein